jgi:hypothetical protein
MKTSVLFLGAILGAALTWMALRPAGVTCFEARYADAVVYADASTSGRG